MRGAKQGKREIARMSPPRIQHSDDTRCRSGFRRFPEFLVLLLRNSDPPHFARNSAAVVAPRGSGPTTARSLLRGSEALGFLGWVTNSGQEH